MAHSPELQRQSNTSTNFEVKKSFAYSAVSYLLGAVNSNYFGAAKVKSSNSTLQSNQKSPKLDSTINNIGSFAADNVLFGQSFGEM